MQTVLRRAVVTGASKGIGRATALSLWRAGFDLALCARGVDALDAFAAELRVERPTQQVLTKVTDVSVESEVRAFAKTITDAWPEGLNVLVNNAGAFVPGGLLDAADGVLAQQINTNLMSAYWLTRALIEGLRQNPGAALIVNVCSVAGLAAYPPSGPYTVSKYALRGFGAALRDELKTQNVKVTTVFPGPTWSASWAGVDLPRERLMEAADVAEAIVSLTRLSPPGGRRGARDASAGGRLVASLR